MAALNVRKSNVRVGIRRRTDVMIIVQTIHYIAATSRAHNNATKHVIVTCIGEHIVITV